ncbi:fatty-acid amide hydrolase 2-like isoform X2 [Anticarsia gemmatalis]
MLKRAFFIFRIYLDMFIDFVFGLIFEGERKKLPELDKRHSILLESAVSLAEKIRTKQLKSEELVRTCIERIQAVNPLINAVTDERFEAALKDAKEVDSMIEKGLPDEYFKDKPFLGVPFTAKESHAVSGLTHTLGILSRRHMRAADDAECVRLMRAAGGIPIVVTNVPEINKWMETRNMVFGQTRNPHHTGRSTGGSSGGEAALHASIAVPISICSDIGGSTRMPAFYCGLYALNPTAGHTSIKGSTLRSGLEPTMASIGFVSRHCSDLAPLTKIVAGDKAAGLNLDRAVDVKKLRYFYVETARDLRVSPICKDLRDTMTKAVTLLTEQAPSSDLAPKPFYHNGFNYMFALWRYWMTRETEVFGKMLTNNSGEAKFIVELPKKLLGMSDFTLAAILKLADDQILPPVNKEWAEQTTKELREELINLLGDDGVLLFPSAPAPAPYHYSPLLRPFNFAYWGIFNVLKFPAAQVPIGLTSDGLPLGIQVVAAPHCDALCLAVAEHLGKSLGGVQAPCNIPQ